jgi:hypothetical protein
MTSRSCALRAGRVADAREIEMIRSSRTETVTLRIGSDRSAETTETFSMSSSRAATGPPQSPSATSNNASFTKPNVPFEYAGHSGRVLEDLANRVAQSTACKWPFWLHSSARTLFGSALEDPHHEKNLCGSCRRFAFVRARHERGARGSAHPLDQRRDREPSGWRRSGRRARLPLRRRFRRDGLEADPRVRAAGVRIRLVWRIR